MQLQPYVGLGGIAYGAIAGYGTLNLTQSSPPQSFTEPLTLTEVLKYLNVPVRDPADPDEADEIQGMMSAAREVAEILQGRDLVRKQWDLSLDYFTKYQIELRSPLVSVDLLRYKQSDGSLVVLAENTDYIVDASKQPGMITPMYNTTWPTFTAWPTSAILCRFTSGLLLNDPFWSDAGQRVKIGMKMLIASWFENRLPFDSRISQYAEYPYAVTSCLSYGALVRVR